VRRIVDQDVDSAESRFRFNSLKKEREIARIKKLTGILPAKGDYSRALLRERQADRDKENRVMMGLPQASPQRGKGDLKRE
jgi:hypothetical protein